ncbi:class D beta-lactamase [Ferruginibacter albus]|uniref:class D beta-lactamase n=1 Tax=Ferruginibacter albus TaxID=2875540 RepID=UPI001CC67D05|nr:class D beta-lactamase [Ferruginibacter albus]UAY51774.1 class D beta-lactamase [Ferruginibacter albus]
MNFSSSFFRYKPVLVFTFCLLSVTFFSCSTRVKIDNDLKKYFDEYKVDGSFEFLNNKTGQITAYNLSLDAQRTLPASTFKIVNSLIGIETGKITDGNMVIKWDGIKRSNEAWNKDMGMKEAFKVSCVPYYQEVARRIGRDTMQYWLDSLHYGNMKIGDRIDSFWLDNSLKISPDEQLGLVKKLYFDQLPFQKRTQKIVREVMTQEDNTLYKLCYKTGLGYDEQHNSIGWIVGWVEENQHPYFFVTLIKTPDKNIDIQKARLSITTAILKQMGFFEGKM